LGKEYIDLYEDNLPIGYAGFKNLHYYSGETVLSFSDYDTFSDQRYSTWLQNNGIDLYNKKLGHGRIPIGIIEDIENVRDKIKLYKHMDSILIKE
jgi:hypothetical protein